jgi:hypothetical protein
MFAIVLAVAVVIDDIDAAGNKRKSDESLKDMDHLLYIQELASEKER